MAVPVTVRFTVELPEWADLERSMDLLLGSAVSGPEGASGRIVYVIPQLLNQRVLACEAEFDADSNIGRYLRRDAFRRVSLGAD